MGPWGQEEKEDLRRDCKNAGCVGKDFSVSGVVSRFQCCTGRTAFGYRTVPTPGVGRCSSGKGLGIVRLCQLCPVEIECEPHVLFYIYQESH